MLRKSGTVLATSSQKRRECPRAAFWTYYADGAKHKAKWAKLFKTVSTPDLAAGDIVHRHIADAMWIHRLDGNIPGSIVDAGLADFRK